MSSNCLQCLSEKHQPIFSSDLTDEHVLLVLLVHLVHLVLLTGTFLPSSPESSSSLSFILMTSKIGSESNAAASVFDSLMQFVSVRKVRPITVSLRPNSPSIIHVRSNKQTPLFSLSAFQNRKWEELKRRVVTAGETNHTSCFT